MKKSRVSLHSLVYASLFGALTAAGAYITVPMFPVPLTLQNLFTMLAGLLLGGPTAALSQIVYVLIGIMGFPVFAGGKAGLGVLLGPTGGYLLGFILGAYVIGLLARSPNGRGGILRPLSAIVAGHAVIYSLGVLQLSLVAHLSLTKALIVGAVPFLPGDAIKSAAALLVAARIAKHWRLAGRPVLHD